MSELGRETRLYIGALLAVSLGALALSVSWMMPVSASEIAQACLIAGAIALAWLFPVPVATRTKFYVDTAVIVAAVLLLQPALAMVAVGTGTLVAHGLRRVDRDWAQALFNTAQVMLITFVAATVLAAGGWDPRAGIAPDLPVVPYLIVAAAIMFLLSILVVSIVAALETSVPVTARMRSDLADVSRAEVAAHIALVAVGLLAAILASVRPWTLILLAFPLGAIYATLRQQDRVRQETERARMQSDGALLEAQHLARVGSWEWLPGSDCWSWSDEGSRLMELTPNGSMPSTTVFLDSVHPDDRAQVATALQLARGELSPFTLSHRVIVPDTDQERFVRHRADIQHSGALPHRYMGTVHDVTDQVRVEAAMQQARAAAEEADRAKSSLLSMASHDMRTPLTAIQGYLETVLSGSLGPVPDEQREDLQIALRNAQQLTQLVRDLLDLARIEVGRLPLQRRAVDVPKAIDAVLETVDPLAATKRVQVEANIAPGCPPVDADPERLHQVLLNVVGNAIKFTEHGAVRVTAGRQADQVEIIVTDTGPGIDPAQLPHIFDVFHQAGATGRDGTGLGLAIVKQLVTLHGGTISASSVLGDGTTITIGLPAAAIAPDNPDQSPDTSLSPVGKG